jgi:hypothetical protein
MNKIDSYKNIPHFYDWASTSVSHMIGTSAGDLISLDSEIAGPISPSPPPCHPPLGPLVKPCRSEPADSSAAPIPITAQVKIQMGDSLDDGAYKKTDYYEVLRRRSFEEPQAAYPCLLDAEDGVALY